MNDGKKYEGDPNDMESIFRFMHNTDVFRKFRNVMEERFKNKPKVTKIPADFIPEMLSWEVPPEQEVMKLSYIFKWIPIVAMGICEESELNSGTLSVETLKKAELVVKYFWFKSLEEGVDRLNDGERIVNKLELEKN